MTYQQEIIFIWTRCTSKYLTILWIFGYDAIHAQFGDRFVVLLGTGLLQIHWTKVTQVLPIYAYILLLLWKRWLF